VLAISPNCYDGQHPVSMTKLKEREKSALHLELSQKFDFQPLTTKSDNNVYPTVETLQIWLFLGGFLFCEN